MEGTCETGECPGLFCGRVNLTNETTVCFSDCQACPTGYRVGNDSLCQPCDESASARDYLYFVFVSMLALSLRLVITTAANVPMLRRKNYWLILLYVVPLVETAVAMILTLLVVPPLGSLSFNSCGVKSISDFYPIFFNPTVDYMTHLQCTYEVVYPLYSIIFIFFGFLFALHLPLLLVGLILPFVFEKKGYERPWKTRMEYMWLIVFALLLLAHSILAGVVYYVFDFLIIAISLGAFAILSTILHLLNHGEEFRNPFLMFKNPVQWAITFSTMTLFACGILSLTEFEGISFRALLIPIVLAPPILHPFIAHFASPLYYLAAWRMGNSRNFYDFY